MSPRIYLITGASRGIGLALVNEIASKNAPKSVFVFAGVRDPSKATALQAIADKYPGVIEIVSYLSSDVEVNKQLAQMIKDKVGHVDIVIANAGISKLGKIADTSVENLGQHLKINTIGAIVLFQSMFDLLKASSTPKFVIMSSGAGSVSSANMFDLGFSFYGASKAALNYLARKIHLENPWLICFPLAPGMVNTDMSREGNKEEVTGELAKLSAASGREPDVAATLLVGIVDKGTREDSSGEFLNIDGTKFPW